MAEAPQSFEKHTRWDPLFHFFMGPVAIITFIWICYNAYHVRNAWAYWQIIVAIAAIVAIFKIRLYPLKAQDRVIRLEERLRLASLVTQEFHPRINQLSERQLVALRFCCDEELAALAKRALDEKLDAKAIKQSIKQWRADHFRV